MSKQIYELKELAFLKDNLPWGKNTSTLVGGCFDVLHYGHICFLNEAKKTSDKLIVALESDEFIIKAKKRQPVHNILMRANALTSLKNVDFVVILPYLTTYKQYEDLVGIIKPNVIAVTKNDSQLENKKLMAKTFNSKVIEVTDLVGGLSSSGIINKFK